ncbi:hypothetical protein ACGFI9_35435 [Micromonospora sp. NPDC048930]|uniref:hypothetical protein n=1 Tax=Micromonospora sp. NPDC048930 TaxID=3364261 RepID=UPI0037206389
MPVYLDADGVPLAACRAAGARGIVLQALGIGNPTPGVLEEVRASVAVGMVVLVTSRCPGGTSPRSTAREEGLTSPPPAHSSRGHCRLRRRACFLLRLSAASKSHDAR